MKRVIYIRHAKSSWSEVGVTDKDRKLNSRGLRDAPIMANQLLQILVNSKVTVDKILCSSAKRTRETIQHFINNGFSSASISYYDNLYHASEQELLACLYGLSQDVETIIVCAHNPGLTYLAFNAGFETDNIPTSGIFELKFNTQEWNDVSVQNAKKGFYIYPKLYTNE